MIDIFYKTYKQDFEWIKYSLKSLKKHVKGYNKIIIIVPKEDEYLFNTTPFDLPENVFVKGVSEYGTGYLYQQWCKISAHTYSDADYIMFADSDCIFDHDIDLNDFIKEGNPEILYTDYLKVGDAICWKQVTEDFIKEPQQFEFMRRNCLIYHRRTLENVCNYEKNLEYIIMNSERFSEFNAIGAYAFKYEKEKYNFVNTDNWQYTQPKAKQYHSYTEIEKMKLEFPEL